MDHLLRLLLAKITRDQGFPPEVFGYGPKEQGAAYLKPIEQVLIAFTEQVLADPETFGVTEEVTLRSAVLYHALQAIFREATGHIQTKFRPHGPRFLEAALYGLEEGRSDLLRSLDDRISLELARRQAREKRGVSTGRTSQTTNSTTLQDAQIGFLDRALTTISEHLSDMRQGAWSVLDSDNPDAFRQAAHSGRELLDQVLHAVASDDEVKQQRWFQPNPDSKTGITRRHRIQLALEKRGAAASDKDLAIADAAGALVSAVADKLAAQSHARDTVAREQVAASLHALEAALRLILTPPTASKP